MNKLMEWNILLPSVASIPSLNAFRDRPDCITGNMPSKLFTPTTERFVDRVAYADL